MNGPVFGDIPACQARTREDRIAGMRPDKALILPLFLICVGCAAPDGGDAAKSGGAIPPLPAEPAAVAEQVRQEFLHAWTGYRKHAWGHDELRPLSLAPHDWHDQTLLMTAVDALDGLILLGFDDEASETAAYILENLSFDRDIEVKTFEINIRLLGGLLSSYQLTGEAGFLDLARDLGDRLLPAFDSATGMPYTFINLQTGEVSGPHSNPAEIGTWILEYGMLSRLTGNPIYHERARAALQALFDRRSAIGLVGTVIDVESGEWQDRTSHVGGRIDSYYEYLFKGWLLFGDAELKAMWDLHIAAVHEHVAFEQSDGLWYGHVDMDSGEKLATRYGALEAFLPGTLALDGQLERARRLQQSGFAMWNLHGIEPEAIDFSTMTVPDGAAGYVLRPEVIESAYLLHRETGDPLYREMGRTFLSALIQHARTDEAYAAIADVRTMEQADSMESFFLAETLKYLYLLFAEGDPHSISEAVFTTEAHPLWPAGPK